MDGSKTFPLEVSLSHEVGDIAKRIPDSACDIKRDVYMTFEGRGIRRSEDLKNCGTGDGSTVQVMSRMRGGGKHKDKASTAAKKRDRNPKKQHTRGQDAESQLEHNTEKLDDRGHSVPGGRQRRKRLSCFGTMDLSRTIWDLSEGSDEQVEDRIQQYLMKLKDRARMETEEATMIEMTIRWAVGSEERKGAEEDQRRERRGPNCWMWRVALRR